MDGVLFKPRNFWYALHEKFGTLKEGKHLTTKYLHTDYAKLVKEVVGRLWKGKSATEYYTLVKSIEYMSGVAKVFETIKNKDFLTAIISSGSIDLARRAQHDLGIDFIYANELVIQDNTVTGEFIWPMGAGTHKKAEIISHLCTDLGILPKECIYIGDNRTDIESFRLVGLAIAFNSDCDELKKIADHIIETDDLSDILSYIAE